MSNVKIAKQIQHRLAELDKERDALINVLKILNGGSAKSPTSSRLPGPGRPPGSKNKPGAKKPGPKSKTSSKNKR